MTYATQGDTGGSSLSFGPVPIALLGIVAAAKFNGDPIRPNAANLYIADDSSKVTYDVDVHLPEIGLLRLVDVVNAFPRPATGFKMICHRPGLAVLGARVGGVNQFQFVEHYYAEECS